MADEVFTFDNQGVRRIVSAVRKVERDTGQRPGPAVPNLGHNIQFLRVTDVKTTAGGIDYYPARLQVFGRTTGTKADATPTAELWLRNVTGSDLLTDGTGIYQAKQLRDSWDVAGDKRPLFITTGTECDTDAGSFPTVDETNANAGFKFLGTDPVLGTRNLTLSDLSKAAQKAQGVFTITYSATPTWDWHNGLRQRLTMTGNPTISIAGDWDSGSANIETVQDATGGRVPTFGFTTITWAGGIAPRPTLTANGRDLYNFERIASGNYRGVAMLNR